MADKLSAEEKQEMLKVARRMAKRMMREEGQDSADTETFREYWKEHKSRFIALSRVARAGYLGVK